MKDMTTERTCRDLLPTIDFKACLRQGVYPIKIQDIIDQAPVPKKVQRGTKEEIAGYLALHGEEYCKLMQTYFPQQLDAFKRRNFELGEKSTVSKPNKNAMKRANRQREEQARLKEQARFEESQRIIAQAKQAEAQRLKEEEKLKEQEENDFAKLFSKIDDLCEEDSAAIPLKEIGQSDSDSDEEDEKYTRLFDQAVPEEDGFSFLPNFGKKLERRSPFKKEVSEDNDDNLFKKKGSFKHNRSYYN